MFKDSPKIFKQASNKILLDSVNRSGIENATGYYDAASERITILPLAFQVSPRNPSNLNFTLYHEMAHAVDHKKSRLGGKYGLSKEDDAYKRAKLHDNKHQNENYYGTVLVPEGTEEKIHEDFAESLAMTALIRDGKYSSAVMFLSDGGKQTCKRWVKHFKYRYNYCKNILEETSLKRMIKKYINMVFKDAYS